MISSTAADSLKLLHLVHLNAVHIGMDMLDQLWTSRTNQLVIHVFRALLPLALAFGLRLAVEVVIACPQRVTPNDCHAAYGVH